MTTKCNHDDEWRQSVTLELKTRSPVLQPVPMARLNRSGYCLHDGRVDALAFESGD